MTNYYRYLSAILILVMTPLAGELGKRVKVNGSEEGLEVSEEKLSFLIG